MVNSSVTLPKHCTLGKVVVADFPSDSSQTLQGDTAQHGSTVLRRVGRHARGLLGHKQLASSACSASARAMPVQPSSLKSTCVK